MATKRFFAHPLCVTEALPLSPSGNPQEWLLTKEKSHHSLMGFKHKCGRLINYNSCGSASRYLKVFIVRHCKRCIISCGADSQMLCLSRSRIINIRELKCRLEATRRTWDWGMLHTGIIDKISLILWYSLFNARMHYSCLGFIYVKHTKESQSKNFKHY